MTKLEHFDESVAQKYLRKDGWFDFQDENGPFQFDVVIEEKTGQSPEKRVSDVLGVTNVKQHINPMSPNRNRQSIAKGFGPDTRSSNLKEILTPGRGVRYSTFRENERRSVRRDKNNSDYADQAAFQKQQTFQKR